MLIEDASQLDEIEKLWSEFLRTEDVRRLELLRTIMPNIIATLRHHLGDPAKLEATRQSGPVLEDRVTRLEQQAAETARLLNQILAGKYGI